MHVRKEPTSCKWVHRTEPPKYSLDTSANPNEVTKKLQCIWISSIGECPFENQDEIEIDNLAADDMAILVPA